MLPSNLKCRISPKSDNSGNGRKINPAALLTALGIVYGDIGTSPLYVYQAIKKATGQISETAALGSLSLVFWTLIIIVAVKYCIFVMLADNRGEGGILALMSLTHASWRVATADIFFWSAWRARLCSTATGSSLRPFRY